VRSSSIEELLRMFLSPERIADYRCEACGCTGTTTKRFSIEQAPETLVLVLNRFGYDVATQSQNKLGADIAVPELLTVPTSAGEQRYRLFSAVIHQGYTPYSGHYFAVGRRSSTAGPEWYKLNDEHVDPVQHYADDFNGNSSTAYVVFYSKVGEPREPPAPPVELFAEAVLNDLKQRQQAAMAPPLVQNEYDQQCYDTIQTNRLAFDTEFIDFVPDP